jgi:hypothetical protein
MILPSLGDPKGFSDHCEARETAAVHAAASTYSMDAATFYEMFPYHLILDDQCRVLQVDVHVYILWALALNIHEEPESINISCLIFDWGDPSCFHRCTHPIPSMPYCPT